MIRQLTVFLIPTIALLCAPAPAVADSDFKDEWFFEGANRPKALRDLEGKPAPELTTKAWIGESTSIAANKGKVVVVDFWATWCGPCMAAIPENVELMKRSADKPLAFIGVHDSKNGWNKAAEVVKSKQINYPVAQDSGESAKAYGLSFWPTYIVIDHEGIVRAAGLIPSHVAEVVELLLAKVPAGASAGSDSTLLGGATRPQWVTGITGHELPTIPADSKWIGTPPADGALVNQPVVMLFFSPAGSAGMAQLAQADSLAKEFAPQGVAFIGVCDSRVDWAVAAPAIEARKLGIPVVLDAALPGVGGTESPTRLGAMAAQLGVRLAPIILVFDRSGHVRVAGVRPDRLKQVINDMLAEQPAPAAASPSASN